LGAQLARDLAVDGHAPGDDQILGLAARRHARLREVALQADRGHAAVSSSSCIGAASTSSCSCPCCWSTTLRCSSLSSEYSRRVGSSRRSLRLKKSRKSLVVPYSSRRPTSSFLPRMRI